MLEQQVTEPGQGPENVRMVQGSGEILRMAAEGGMIAWPVEAGDDAALAQFRDYARQLAAISREADSEANRIAVDPHLSHEGKEAALRASAETALQRAALIGEKIEKFSGNVQREISAPLPATRDYDAARPWEVTFDLELVRMVRDMPAAERGALLTGLRNGSGGSHRMADALLRVPMELSGLSAVQHAELTRAAQQRLSPDKYQRREAITTAQAALAGFMRNAAHRIAHPKIPAAPARAAAPGQPQQAAPPLSVVLTAGDRRALLGDRARFVE
jgi:hypothetical protein